MTNTELLEKIIKESGKKKGYLAEKAGMSAAWLRACIYNEGEFRESQMHALAQELNIEDPPTFMAVFFAQDGA